MIKPTDIPDSARDRFAELVLGVVANDYKAILAAAINATTPPDNDSPITGDWLDKVYRKIGMFWISPQQDDSSKPLLRILTPDAIEMYPSSDAYTFIGQSIRVTFNTRGELRAWHIAHRQPLIEVE